MSPWKYYISQFLKEKMYYFKNKQTKNKQTKKENICHHKLLRLSFLNSYNDFQHTSCSYYWQQADSKCGFLQDSSHRKLTAEFRFKLEESSQRLQAVTVCALSLTVYFFFSKRLIVYLTRKRKNHISCLLCPLICVAYVEMKNFFPFSLIIGEKAMQPNM